MSPHDSDSIVAVPDAEIVAKLTKEAAELPPEAFADFETRVKQRRALTAPIDTVDPPPRLPFETDLGAIARGGIPEPERLIENLLYANRIHWLSGHPGHGKTTIAADAARQHMKAGGHVVWLDWEGGKWQTVARMLAVGAYADQLDALFHLVVGAPLQATPDGFAPIAAALKEYPGALVVFDSASKALSAAGFDENSSTEATKWTTQIILPTREAGATVIVIDHVVKGATKATPYARGAGSKLADTDAAWYVEATVKFNRETPGKIELTRHKDREGLLPERLSFDVGDGAGNLPVVAAEVENEQTKSKREAGLRGKVLAVLEEHTTPGRELNTRQIVELVHAKKANVVAALGELVADGSTGVVQAPGPRSAVLYWHDPDTVRALSTRGGNALELS